PNYARGHALLSRTYSSAWIQPLDSDFLKPETLARAHRTARSAVQLDPNLPQARAQLGYVLAFEGQHALSIAEFERAFARNPNFPDSRFACALAFAGEFARAVQAAQDHMRADPFYLSVTSGYLGLAFYMLKDYAEALPQLEETVSRAPNWRDGRIWLAATYAQMGRSERARREA